MINLILKSISVALNAEFNEKEYEIYIEQIKQDLKEPCFFIGLTINKTTCYAGEFPDSFSFK